MLHVQTRQDHEMGVCFVYERLELRSLALLTIVELHQLQLLWYIYTLCAVWKGEFWSRTLATASTIYGGCHSTLNSRTLSTVGPVWYRTTDEVAVALAAMKNVIFEANGTLYSFIHWHGTVYVRKCNHILTTGQIVGVKRVFHFSVRHFVTRSSVIKISHNYTPAWCNMYRNVTNLNWDEYIMSNQMVFSFCLRNLVMEAQL